MKILVPLSTLALCLFSCVPLALSQDAPKKQKMDPNKPAVEQFKNIQVFKNATVGEVLGHMRAFNAALGVQCGFCHVDGDRAADTKGEKLTARKMIAMTHDINEKFFNGKAEVKCYTCHKGAEHPAEPPAAN